MNLRKKNKKGQVVVYDFIFGFITFIVIITLITLMWFKATARVTQEIDQEMKLKIAHDISSILTQTPGNPPRWELNKTFYNNVDNNFTLGLAIDNNVISKNKLRAFIYMNSTPGGGVGYGKIREDLLRLGRYNFYMKIREGNEVVNTTGRPPKENLSATISRKVIIDGEIKTFEFTIY